jgi:hypothetical protein
MTVPPLPNSVASDPLTDRSSDAMTRPAVPVLLGVAVVALGLALDVDFGQFHPRAAAWLAVAVVACLTAVTRCGPAAVTGTSAALWLVPLGLQAAVLLARDPAVPGAGGAAAPALPWVRGGVLLVAACAAAAVVGPARGRAGWVAAMVAAHFLTGLLVLRAHPVPGVDVVVFQRDACAAVLAGRSPYGITFPDVSPPGTAFYAPGVSVGGRLQFGFPYPPASLLLVLPFHLLGDVRLAGLLATSAAGWLVARARPGPRAAAAAGLLLLTPSGLFVLWAGWTEPLGVALLALVVFVAAREARGTSGRYAAGAVLGPFDNPTLRLVVALGLLLAVKQYFVLLLPLVGLLVPRGWRWRAVLGAAAVAAAVSLPLALTDAGGFLRSVVWLQFRQPYRADALSFLAPLHAFLPHAAASGVPLALAASAIAWTVRRCPRTPGGFALAASAVLLVFFAFNKQAFCNYYHLVVGGLCCAIGAWERVSDSPDARESHAGV